MSQAIEGRAARHLWAVALESGQYAQGKNALHKVASTGQHTYCCLGVACDLAVKAGVIPPPPLPKSGVPGPGDGASYYAYYYGADQPQASILPYEVLEWLDLDDPRGMVRGTGESLAALNDSGVTFARIAELIRDGQIKTKHDEPDWADQILDGSES